MIEMLKALPGLILRGDEVAVGVGAHGMVLQGPEKFGEDVHLFVRPGGLLDMVEEGVLGLEEFAEGEVMVRGGRSWMP